MYFDKIERSEVTDLLDGIYKNVHLLEDVQFLVQYAPQVLPPTVQEASGERIWANILTLQEDLTNKREVIPSSIHLFVCCIDALRLLSTRRICNKTLMIYTRLVLFLLSIECRRR